MTTKKTMKSTISRAGGPHLGAPVLAALWPEVGSALPKGPSEAEGEATELPPEHRVCPSQNSTGQRHNSLRTVSPFANRIIPVAPVHICARIRNMALGLKNVFHIIDRRRVVMLDQTACRRFTKFVYCILAA